MAPHRISPTAGERPGTTGLAARTKITAQGPFSREDCRVLFMGAERGGEGHSSPILENLVA